jgi:hypothetical protein
MSNLPQPESPVGTGRVTALGSVAISIMSREGGFIFDRRYYFDPDYRWEQDKRIARWAEDRFAPYPFYNAEAHLVQLAEQPIPFRQVGGLQPNLLLGAALGAELVFYGDHDPDIAGTPLAGLLQSQALPEIAWEDREPLATLLRQIDELRASSRGAFDVFPPFFWDRSGRATVHGPLTTAVKLIGNDFFILLLEDFGWAREILLWISKSYNALVKLFAERAALPVTGIHIGECAGCMVPANVWRNAILPAMNIMVDAWGPVRIHSCGRSDHLLAAMASVHNLGVFNIGSGTSIARARERIGRSVTIDVIPDAQLLLRGTPGEVAAWVERSLAENGSGPLEFQVHLEAGAPFENAAAIFDALRAHGHEPYAESLVKRWKI